MNSLITSNRFNGTCVPFASGPVRRPGMRTRRLVARASNGEDNKACSTLARIGRFCGPLAAAAMLFVQSTPVMAETYEESLRRGQELGSEKLDFQSFFNKGKEKVKGAINATKDASDPSKASTNVPKEIPTFGKPVETSSSVSKVAEDVKNKVDPSKVDTAAKKAEQTVGGSDDKAPGEGIFKSIFKEGVKDNTGSGSNSNQQAAVAPAKADKEEEAELKKIESFQKKSESGNPDRPRLDPSVVEGEPEPGPAPGVSNKLPEQPKPEPGTFQQLGKDSSGGRVQESKGSGPLNPFGGGPSGETPTSKAETLIEKSEQPQSGNIFDFIQKGFDGTSSLPTKTNDVGTLADLEAPQPSSLEEKEPEKAPGVENAPPEQPKPEPGTPSELGKDSAGGKTGNTQAGGGILDFFGGSPNNQSAAPQPKSGVTLASNRLDSNAGFLYLLADSGLKPPQPTELDEPEPAAAPGSKNKLPDQPRPEPSSFQTPQDSSGGKVKNTNQGSGLLDFFGGSGIENTAKEAESNVKKAESNEVGSVSSVEVAQLSESLSPPQPTELDEPEPAAAPGSKNELPDQPRPEPSSFQTPEDSAGGKVKPTKGGDAPLDFFGGSGTENTKKEATSNVQKAASNEVGSVSSSEIAQLSEAEGSGPDQGKATLIGVGFSIALEIAILSSYGSGSKAEKH